MSKLKIVFSSLIVGLMTVGCICLGLPLSLPDFSLPTAANETVVNNLQPYVKLTNDARKASDFVYLMSGENTFNLTIAENDFSYIPNSQNLNEFYYFDFNNIALYHNVTNDNLSSIDNLQNLLNNISTNTKFITHSENTPDGYSFQPEKLDIKIALKKNNESIKVDNNLVTLNEEGAYTLAINMDVYYTTNGGMTFNILEDQSELFYTFMIFDYGTYYNTASNRPNTVMSNQIRSSSLSNTQNSYSMYYYYNYSNSNLPNFEYNPSLYEMSIRYTSVDNIPYYTTVKLDGERIYFLDADKNEYDCDFLFARYNDGKINLTFNDLGSYDLIFNLVYAVNGHVYDLPIDTLNQRLYNFGYQIYFTDLGTIDPDTHTTVQEEFKLLNPDKTQFYNAADITSQLSDILETSNYNPSSASKDMDELKTAIKSKLTNITPATTNQAPIKFKSNITPNNNSIIYQVTSKNNEITISDGSTFDGGNINIAGTYLIITDYTYSQFTAVNGVAQTHAHHYQVFYFTYDDKISTYEVRDSNNSLLSNRAFTNNNVFVINNSASKPFDAQATITLSAVNYLTKQPLWQGEKDITTFNGEFGINYNAGNLLGDNNSYGISIDSTTNATFTVRIYEKNSEVPTTSIFTIDTSPINNLRATTATPSSNSLYRLGDIIEGNKSNNPIVFAWDNKDSGAITYGYYYYYPLTSSTFYHHTESGDSSLLSFLSRKGDDYFLPIEAKLDLKTTENAIWPKYENASGYSTTIPKSYVKEEAGLYIIEVYDQAGNSDFGIYLIDKSSPIFVKNIESNAGDTRSILSSGDIITIPEQKELNNGYDVSIEWAPYKGIYLKNFDISNFSIYISNNLPDSAASQLQEKLQERLNQFFGGVVNQTTGGMRYENIAQIESNMTATPPEAWNEASKYSGNYLKIAVDSNHLFKDRIQDTPSLRQGYNYHFDLITNGSANEGTYAFYVRDESNSAKFGNIEYALSNYPSAYMSVTVSSDSSKLKITSENSVLEFEGYSLVGNFYEKNGEDLKYNAEDGFSPSKLNYRFAYYVPVKTEAPLTISFVPFAQDGNKVESITVYYYGYDKKSEEVKSLPENGEQVLGTTYYYTLKETPEIIPIFEYTKEYQQGEIKEVTLSSSGGNSTANAGKYVIVRRYFKENESTNTYDYYERKITLMVDRYNVISERENVTNDNKVSSQSVVGHDMLVTMYSLPTQSTLQVSFPYLNENNGGLNSGSFHTVDSTDEATEIATSLTTNKLPLSVKIPEYKYTQNYNYHKDDNSYSVNKNDTLSYFGNAKIIEPTDDDQYYYVEVDGAKKRFDTKDEAKEYIEETIIPEYKLYAVIEYRSSNTASPIFYKTNGVATNGYLNFYRVNSIDENVSDTATAAIFTNAGSYYVTIYQAQNRGNNAAFSNSYRFKFVINSPEPDFTVYNGNDIKANSVVNGEETYYVNTKNISIKWQDSDSRYIANLDKDKILISINGYELQSSQFKVKDEGTLAHRIDLDLGSDAFKEYSAWQNNSEISITMQLEGHSEYYNKVTKRIIVDYSAPLEHISSLMSNVTNAYSPFDRLYQEKNMRSLLNNEGDEINLSNWTLDTIDKNLEEVSFSYSVNANSTFKYYAYNVTKDFFDSLASSLTNDTLPTDASFIYYKEIGDIETYLTSYTQTRNFSSFTYDDIKEIDYITSNHYYEIVEQDFAGNTTIYIVHVYDPNENLAVKYHNSEESDVIINNSVLYDEFDIYSITGFELEQLNYLSDPWGIYRVNIYRQNQIIYMKSPWLQLDNQGEYNEGLASIYRIISNGNDFIETEIKNIFKDIPSQERKHHVTLIDRFMGSAMDLRVSIMNSSFTYNEYSTPTSATLEIRVPNESQANDANYAWLYPTNISISQRIASGNNTSSWDSLVTNISNNTGNPNLWNSTNSAVSITYSASGYLVITINLEANSNNLFKYEITDNFKKKTNILQLVNSPDFNEVEGEKNIYEKVEADRSITYLTSGNIRYQYNSLIYNAIIKDSKGDEINDIRIVENSVTKVNYINFTKTGVYFIELYDITVEDEQTPSRKVNIRIYDRLPSFYDSDSVQTPFIWFQDKNNEPISGSTSSRTETVIINGKHYMARSKILTTYSNNVTAYFSASQPSYEDVNASYNNEYSYSVYFSNDNGSTWINVNDYAVNGFSFIGTGDYKFLIIYDDETVLTDVCQIYSIKILDSSSVYYTVQLSDGELVEMAYDMDGNPLKYMVYDDNGRPAGEITENYIVSVDYSNHDSVKKEGSKALNIEVELERHYPAGNGVEVEIWSYYGDNIKSAFSVIYIGQTDDKDRPLLDLLKYEDISSTPDIDLHSNYLQIPVNSEGFNLKLYWTDHFGINENKINIEVLKLFNNEDTKVDVKVFSNGTTRYTTLSRAGTYKIRFYDSCSPCNQQYFGSINNTCLNLVLLNTTPFTVSYKDPTTGETHVTEPNTRAVYNDEVTLSLSNHFTYFHHAPDIEVYKDGSEQPYTGYDTSINNYTYTFKENGYYVVKFVNAETKEGEPIGQEEFVFTIINQNESRYAYEFSPYSDYYVQRVIKNGIDITRSLVDLASKNDIVTINDEKYLTKLLLSYFDEKTGAGRYTITINTGEEIYTNSSISEFTFSLWINLATPPVSVSIANGGATTDNITLNFNAYTLYDTVGDCYIQIGNDRFDVNAETLASLGGEGAAITITKNGTYYIQIYTTSNTLLYSYKVTKNEPLNTWAIIAIVVGVLAVGVIIFITIKLRKRLKVK